MLDTNDVNNRSTFQMDVGHGRESNSGSSGVVSTARTDSIQPHPNSIRHNPIYLPNHQPPNQVHPSVLTANMIKSGLYPVSGPASNKRAMSALGIFFRLLFALMMVGIPILVLFYFIYYEPLHHLQGSASERNEEHLRPNVVDQLYKVDSMSSVYVKTKSGAIQGERLEVLNKEIDIFLGIPYAEPPVGDLRFRKPKDVKPWSGVYRAIRHSRPCLQFKLSHRVKETPWISEETSSEDCLHLNVWAPGNSGKNLKPVMVWIHGGAFISGSADVEFYDGGVLSAYGDVVIVTFNYRLGIFGFLTASHESAPGNMGLHDQAAALKWVKANIEAFGGDPERVTLFGESAGAFSVGFHMISPITRDLFSRAILQSRSPLYPQVLEDQAFAIDRAQQLAIRVSCANDRINIYRHAEDVISCLRKLEANFLAKSADEMMSGFHPPFGVTVGNEFLPVGPYEAIKRDEELGTKRKQILIGSVKDEGSFFLHWTFPTIFSAKNPKKVSAHQVQPLVDEAFKFMPQPGSKLISHFFMNDMNMTDYAAIRQKFYETIGDFIITCPQVFFSEQMSEKNSTVYNYQFTHRPSNTKWGKWMGVVHFDEIQFVFGIPYIKPNDYTDEEREFSARLMETWVTFERYGKPSVQMGKHWPEYYSEDRRYMELNPTSNTIGLGPHENQCNMWRFMFETVSPQKQGRR